MAETLFKSQQAFGGDGWQPAKETWSYVSIDDPTGVFRINADVTTKYSAGMRIKFTNGGNVIKGIITAVSAYNAVDAGYTHITFLHEIDPTDSLALYLMANSAITLNYYSSQKAPQGFPLDPSKWTQVASDTSERSQNPNTAGTWYNLGSLSLSVPIGAWNLEYYVYIYAAKSGDGIASLSSALSTANNSVSDTGLYLISGMYYVAGEFGVPHLKSKLVTLTAKTPYYLISSSSINGAGNVLYNINNVIPATIKAVCAYL